MDTYQAAREAALAAVDGCWHVYLDVGSNQGIQVRKLFEPKLYPRARSIRVYDRLLGDQRARRQTVCALGIEANPAHDARLKQLEQRYVDFGWSTRFLVSVAAARNDSVSTSFFLDRSGDPLAHGTEWWASTVQHQYNSHDALVRGGHTTSANRTWDSVRVRTIDLAWLVERILQRRLPNRPPQGTTGPPRLLMKMDIEGGEYSLLPLLLARGLICRLDFLWLEIHDGQSTEHRELARAAGAPQPLGRGPYSQRFREVFGYIMRQAADATCAVEVDTKGDESYGGSNLPLPKHVSTPTALWRQGSAARVLEARIGRLRAGAACDLVQQTSIAANCTPGVSYGCDRAGVWVAHGCRGTFSRNGSRVNCGRRGASVTWAHCANWTLGVFRQKPASDPMRIVSERGSWDVALGKWLLRRDSSETWLASSNTTELVAILVAVVAGSGLEVQQRALRGMEAADTAYSALHARIDWAVITYDDNAGLWAGTVEASRRLQRTTVVLVLNASSNATHPLEHHERKARFVHQRRLVWAVWNRTGRAAYDAVWLPDDDLAFERFDWRAFLHQWLCTFPGGSPIVAQPPIQSKKGWHRSRSAWGKTWPAAAGTWRSCMVGELGAAFGGDACFLRHTRALQVGFVEGQAALLDAHFLSWLFEQPLIERIVSAQLSHGSEAGPDAVWCGAAAEWWALRRDTAAFRPGCAVVPVPIWHDDTRSLDAGSALHFNNGFKVLRDAEIRYQPRRGCQGRACMVHNWTRYQPVPNWPLPTDVAGMEQVRACATTRMHHAVCSSLPRDRTGGGVRFSASVSARAETSGQLASSPGPATHLHSIKCDELTGLYWRRNSF